LTGAKALDSANLRITYSLVFVADSAKPNEKLNDRKVLLIGNAIHHFYSYYARLSDSTATMEESKAGPKRGFKFPTGVCAERYEIYNNYPVGEQTVIENIGLTQIIIYKDNSIPKWSFTSDTSTILNYFCHKAVCRYHGRNWEAWFTLDIPLDAGPWKLRGLPGLILKASDSRQHYVFECIGIEKLKNPAPILMYKVAHEAFLNSVPFSTREGFLKKQRNFHENYMTVLSSMGYHIRILDDSGKRIETIEPLNTEYAERNVAFSRSIYARDRNKKVPYNPIELE
jgi:GLPGLI family protein